MTDDCRCYMDDPGAGGREELLAGGLTLGLMLGGAFLLGAGVTVAAAVIAGAA